MAFGLGCLTICCSRAAGPAAILAQRKEMAGRTPMITRRRTLALGGAFAAGPILPARAQSDWPSRPLRILVGTAPGGSPDIMSRMLADKISPRLGQSVTVEN